VPELAKKIAELLELLPILTIPVMVKRLIGLVLRTLAKVRDRLQALQEEMTRIEAAIDHGKDINDAGLLALGQCAKANCAQEADNLMKSLVGVGRLLMIIQFFMSFVPGAPQIPDLTSLTGQPLESVIEPLDGIVEVLQIAYNAIPLP
jgi:hypothetical protein